jgi:hypothetical protein
MGVAFTNSNFSYWAALRDICITALNASLGVEDGAHTWRFRVNLRFTLQRSQLFTQTHAQAI